MACRKYEPIALFPPRIRWIVAHYSTEIEHCENIRRTERPSGMPTFRFDKLSNYVAPDSLSYFVKLVVRMVSGIGERLERIVAVTSNKLRARHWPCWAVKAG